MRVLAVSNVYPPHYLGGYELLCSQACGALARNGHRVRVLTSVHGLDRESQDGGADDGGAIEVQRRLRLAGPFERPADNSRWRRLRVWRVNRDITRREVARFRPDVLFLWSQLRLTTGPAQAAELSGVPVVYSFNDHHIASYLPAPPGGALRALARHAADHWLWPGLTTRGLAFRHVACISQLLKRRLVSQGLPIESARVIYQGVPVERFQPKACPGQLAMPLRLLYTGQLHDYKGVHTLLAAAHHVARRHGPGRVAVSVVGDGPASYRADLARLADSGPAPVAFIGKVPYESMPGIYRDHCVLVFPSIWEEPFGLTHLEAMACGTPVIGTNHGGQGELLVDGVNALVFPPGDAVQLAAQIERLMAQPDLARRLACRAHLDVTSRFCATRYTRELESLLAEAVAACGAPAPARTAWQEKSVLTEMTVNI